MEEYTQVRVEYNPKSMEERILLIACLRNSSRENYERFEEMVEDLKSGKFESQYTELVSSLLEQDRKTISNLLEVERFLAKEIVENSKRACSCQSVPANEKKVIQKPWWED